MCRYVHFTVAPSSLLRANMTAALSSQTASPTMLHSVVTNSGLDSIHYPCRQISGTDQQSFKRRLNDFTITEKAPTRALEPS